MCSFSRGGHSMLCVEPRVASPCDTPGTTKDSTSWRLRFHFWRYVGRLVVFDLLVRAEWTWMFLI